MVTEYEITASGSGDVIMRPQNSVDLRVINQILAPDLVRPVDGSTYAVFASGGNHWVIGVAFYPEFTALCRTA